MTARSAAAQTCARVSAAPHSCAVIRSTDFARGVVTACLGDELEAFLKRHQPEFDRIVYVGDGSNDFCPVLRMRK